MKRVLIEKTGKIFKENKRKKIKLTYCKGKTVE